MCECWFVLPYEYIHKTEILVMLEKLWSRYRKESSAVTTVLSKSFMLLLVWRLANCPENVPNRSGLDYSFCRSPVFGVLAYDRFGLAFFLEPLFCALPFALTSRFFPLLICDIREGFDDTLSAPIDRSLSSTCGCEHVMGLPSAVSVSFSLGSGWPGWVTWTCLF